MATQFPARFASLVEEEGTVCWDKGIDGVLMLSKAPNGTDVIVCTSNSGTVVLQTSLAPCKPAIWRGTGCIFFISPSAGQAAGGTCLVARCRDKGTADSLQAALDALMHQQQQPATANGNAHCTGQADGPKMAPGGPQGTNGPAAGGSGPGTSGSGGNVFDAKTDRGSSDMYFKYYGMLQHQQNMLQDYTRTGMYYMAITENRADFEGKVVMDVGAGSGILSLFAAMAGARKVYAVEASGMARFARRLADGNPELGQRIQIINSKVEEANVPEKVDVLVSEPMGTLLVNERMLETYLYARDRFLKPGGKMFPQLGRIHVAAFRDDALHAEVGAKAVFWTQNNFYGVDVSPLYTAAVDSYFSQVVVDAFDHSVLVSNCETKVFDFGTCPENSLHDINIPLNLQISAPGPSTIHGVACWFDVFFHGANTPVWLSTAPGLPTTHWFQLRCVFKTPILVPGPGCTLVGHLRLVAHRCQSYDVQLSLQGPPLVPGGPPQTSSGTFDLKEPYYRQLTNGWWQAAMGGPGGEGAPQNGAPAQNGAPMGMMVGGQQVGFQQAMNI